MSPVRATMRRTVGMARSLFSCTLAVVGFMALSAVAFAFGLESAEGGRLPLSVVWAASVSPLLPVLAAVLAMDVWSDERMTGRIDLLLSVSVRERDLMLGKFLGVLAMFALTLVLTLASTLGALWFCAPQTLAGAWLGSFCLALFALFLQGVSWCAISVALSALFARAAVAACAAVALLVAVPRSLWAGLMMLAPSGRTAFGEMPLDAHVIDFASGLIPVGTALGYAAVSLTALFVGVKSVAACRLVGRGARTLRLSTGLSVVLSLVLCGLALLLFNKVSPVLDLSVSGASSALSPRTCSILAEFGEGVRITCFLPRNDSRFRPVSHLLRQFRRESQSFGGSGIELRFVDPRWDIGAAERLIRSGVEENCLVFEKGRRIVSVPIAGPADKDRLDARAQGSDEGEVFGERLCAATIRRVSAPLQRRSVYWTTGHGETAFDAYGALGLTDIARDLAFEGFRNLPIDLAATAKAPKDCALIVIAGAKDDFSRAEIGWLDAYLRDGGRLLVLLASSKSGGVVSMLPSWGIRPRDLPLHGQKTLTGSDVLVSEFSNHAISAPLQGSRIVLERPIAFEPSAVAEAGTGADRIDFVSVASVGPAAVVAAVERGGATGRDLALRPTRIVVVGDASFALNGPLAARASANRDFILNCVAYLSGTEAHGFGGNVLDTLDSGMDRSGRLRHLVCSGAVIPFAVFLVLVVAVRRRRR